jgi:hypothetical protein
VEQVYDDGSVWLTDIGECSIILNNVPHNVAISLSKGQYIEGYGTIEDIYYILVMVEIHIKIDPDELKVR